MWRLAVAGFIGIMNSLGFRLAFALSVLALRGTDARGADPNGRDLLQASEQVSVTRLRLIDFKNLNNSGDQVVPEMELNGALTISPSDASVQYGAYALGASEVEQINRTIADQLELVPANEAKTAPTVHFPGQFFAGSSVLDSLGNQQPLRIPTVYAPFYSGYKFSLEKRPPPGPGTTLHLFNMTIVVANATYENLPTSGMLDYLDMEQRARVCISNSMFVLESCEGFQPGYIMWCCSMHQCNTVYTENDLLDLGFPIPYNLEYLTCHDRQTTGSTDTRPKYVLHLTIASVALVLGLLGVVLVVALRHRCTHGVGTKQSIERNGEPGTDSHSQVGRGSGYVAPYTVYKSISNRYTPGEHSGDQYAANPDRSAQMCSSERVYDSRSITPRTGSLRDTKDRKPKASWTCLFRRQSVQDDSEQAKTQQMLTLRTVTYDTFDATTKILQPAPVPPGPAADACEHMEYLRRQIDGMMDTIIFDGLVMRKGGTSLQGGQAIVRFAEHSISKAEVAIKFFLSQSAFQGEVTQYTDTSTPLHRFLPRVHAIMDNGDGEHRDSNGYALPSCIVMEKGESLDIWRQRSVKGMDTFTCMQILQHVSECLVDLHGAGYVHRDVKPANIMWLPSQNRWTLIDFGCTARIGEQARLSFSLLYAAPEVLRAYYRSDMKTIEATAAVDAWSVGIIAMELFSAQPALQVLMGQEKVVAQVVGEEPLPWEEEGRARVLLKHSGQFRAPLLSLLERNPAMRPSMSSFLHECSRVVSSNTNDGLQ